MSHLLSLIPETWQATLALRTFSLVKIPLLAFVNPSVAGLSDERAEVVIPLGWRTRNHLGSMYFGALATGADCAAGLLAMRIIRRASVPVSFIFKGMRADFLKRAEGDVHFICEQGAEIAELVARAVSTGERVELPVNITATVPRKLGSEPVATFTLVLSLKKKP